jgi:hypothetical protein
MMRLKFPIYLYGFASTMINFSRNTTIKMETLPFALILIIFVSVVDLTPGKNDLDESSVSERGVNTILYIITK